VRRLACALLIGPAVVLAGAAAGCGSATVHELPPAAEPATSPPAGSTPAGRIVAVGAAPEGVAADPAAGRFAVALRDPDQLALVGVDGSVLRRVALPGAARHLTFDAATGRFLVPAESANRMLEITAAGRVATDVAVGPHPHDSAAVDGRVFVGNEGADTVSVLAGDRAVGRFAVATQPGGLAAADDGRLLAVVSVRERRLELYDPRTDRRVATAPAGVGPTHVVGFENRLYVADTRGNALLVYHLRPTLTLYRRVQLAGAPYGMAIDPVRRRLWVTLTATNELVGLSADSGARTLIRLPTVRQPDSVAVDSTDGTVAVTGRTAGVLQLVDEARAYGSG
jgi:DNA-binding beta-propeller fold protein YncE